MADILFPPSVRDKEPTSDGQARDPECRETPSTMSGRAEFDIDTPGGDWTPSTTDFEMRRRHTEGSTAPDDDLTRRQLDHDKAGILVKL